MKFGSEDYVCEELRLEKDDLTAIVQELRPWVEELEHFVESDGCGHLCALTTLSERALAGNYEVNAFNRCVEVVGDNSGYTIDIAAGVSCAKVLVKSGGIIDGIGASSRVPFARSTKCSDTAHAGQRRQRQCDDRQRGRGQIHQRTIPRPFALALFVPSTPPPRTCRLYP